MVEIREELRDSLNATMGPQFDNDVMGAAGAGLLMNPLVLNAFRVWVIKYGRKFGCEHKALIQQTIQEWISRTVTSPTVAQVLEAVADAVLETMCPGTD